MKERKSEQWTAFATIFLLMLLMLLPRPASSAFYSPDSPALSLEAAKIDPQPAEPGKEFLIQIRVRNDGGKTAEQVRVEIAKNDFFTLRGDENILSTPFSLAAGGSSRENTYYFTVSPSAKTGEYPITFKIFMGSPAVEIDKQFFVKVEANPSLVLVSKVMNDSVAPGDDFTSLVEISNVGGGVAKNVKLSLGAAKFASPALFIERIGAGEHKTASFTVSSSNDLVPGVYIIPVAAAYEDETGATYSASDNMGVKLINRGRLDISAISFNPDPMTAAERSAITIRVENVGEGTAKEIVVVLREPSGAEHKSFIGKLAEQEDAPAFFTIFPESGKNAYGIGISYSDDEGTHRLSDSFDATAVKRDSRTEYAAVAGVILVLALAGYYVYKMGSAG